MKDAFFRWWQRLSDWVYVLVTGFTYLVYSHRQYKGAPALSRQEKARIRQYWKKHYGKTVPLKQYAWIKAKGYDPDPRIIPDIFWHTRVEPAFTNLQMEAGFRDKNYYETIVGRKNSPETLCRCINGQLLDGDYLPLDAQGACSVFKKEAEVICKPSVDSGGGRRILFLSADAVTPETVTNLISEYEGNFIVQKIVKQHAFMSSLNVDSLNTMRITTFLYKGEVHLLYGAVRIGVPKSRLDNFSSGGAYVQLTRDGTMMDYAFQENHAENDLTKMKELPSGADFAGLQIPQWQEIQNLLRKLHYKLPYFKIINWDVALQEDGTPIIIEYNLIDSTPFPDQLSIGPVFGDLTEEVLQDMASRKNRNYGKN